MLSYAGYFSHIFMNFPHPTIGVLIYTHDRVHDARINMELIRNLWSQSELLRDVCIVHAFNGKEAWWPSLYLEDSLVRTDNPGHYEGAELLVNEGVRTFQNKYPTIDYVIVLASDTWCVKPAYIEHLIKEMRTQHTVLATCAWGDLTQQDMFYNGMALDFFIIDLAWATKHHLFPMRYKAFADQYEEAFMYQDMLVYPERVFALRFKQAVMHELKIPSDSLQRSILESRIHHMLEREPIHIDERNTERVMYWKELGILTHHDAHAKQQALREWNIPLGPEGRRFIRATTFDYFNNPTLSSKKIVIPPNSTHQEKQSH